MKQFLPKLTEQNMALIVAALDCFVKQTGVQAAAPVANLVAIFDASVVEVGSPEKVNPEE